MQEIMRSQILNWIATFLRPKFSISEVCVNQDQVNEQVPTFTSAIAKVLYV